MDTEDKVMSMFVVIFLGIILFMVGSLVVDTYRDSYADAMCKSVEMDGGYNLLWTGENMCYFVTQPEIKEYKLLEDVK